MGEQRKHQGTGGGLRFTLDHIEDAPLPGRQEDQPLGAVIKVVGIGGGGNNAINRMVISGVQGVEFIAVNTDAQALAVSRAHTKIQIGGKATRGLGTGGDPNLGREAALEDQEQLKEALAGADMIFVTTGLGGGTGTGASPVIAKLAAEMDALVVAVVTKPFAFEGKRRRKQAEDGLVELKRSVDTVVAIPNDKLLHTVEKATGIEASFMMADDVLRQAVQGISDLILTTGEINRDFADVRTVMKGMGMALMGTGIAEGENRAVEAAQQAISSPLLEDASIQGARGVIINITGGDDLSLHEVNDASLIITEAADPDAVIMFGYVQRREMTGKVKVTVIATGFRTEDRPRRQDARDPWAEQRERMVEDSKRILNQTPDGQPVITPPAVQGNLPPVIPAAGPRSLIEDSSLFPEDSNTVAHLNNPDPMALRDYEIPAFLRRGSD